VIDPRGQNDCHHSKKWGYAVWIPLVPPKMTPMIDVSELGSPSSGLHSVDEIARCLQLSATADAELRIHFQQGFIKRFPLVYTCSSAGVRLVTVRVVELRGKCLQLNNDTAAHQPERDAESCTLQNHLCTVILDSIEANCQCSSV